MTVHEIIPRSKGIVAYREDNMVTLCQDCHDWAHRSPTNNEKMVEYRRMALEKWKTVN